MPELPPPGYPNVLRREPERYRDILPEDNERYEEIRGYFNRGEINSGFAMAELEVLYQRRYPIWTSTAANAKARATLMEWRDFPNGFGPPIFGNPGIVVPAFIPPSTSATTFSEFQYFLLTNLFYSNPF